MAIGVVALSMLSACFVRTYKYHYLALDQRVMPAAEFGTVSDGGEPLRRHEPMPVQYQLDREGYSLMARIGESVSRPTLSWEVKSKGVGELFIEGFIATECYGVIVSTDELYKPPSPQSSQFRFVWTVHNTPSCRKAEVPDVDDLQIMVRISTASGEVVGTETIPFMIRENGYYVVLDLI